MRSNPKLLIVCDYRTSVYDMISDEIAKNIDNRFAIDKVYTIDDPVIKHEEYDVIYLMWWRSKIWEDFHIPREKLCIYVASFWSWQQKFKTPLADLIQHYLGNAICVTVNCPGLYEVFESHHPNVFMNPGGVNIRQFASAPPRSTDTSDPLVAGWAGSATTHGPNKGYYEIIVPACAKTEGVILKSRVKEENEYPHNEMPDFYKDIDVYICASMSEGTPNPVLEAASSSRCVISTSVGIVPMLIEDGHNGFIIERSIAEVCRKLELLRDNRTLCARMGFYNQKRILVDGWSWESRAQGYANMFMKMLEGF